MTNKTKDNDWNVIASLLPDNWENKAYQVGAFNKIRKIDSPQTLLRVLFIHLATGKSLRTTSAYAKEVELCSINDVALLKRLRASSEWLRWMSLEISKTLKITSLPEQLFNKFRVRLVDGSVVNEPGSTGTDWRIHYCILLKNLKCDSFSITSPKTSEGFHLYPVEQGDLLIGDRGYCKRKGIKYILKNKGEAMVRCNDLQSKVTGIAISRFYRTTIIATIQSPGLTLSATRLKLIATEPTIIATGSH